MSNSIDDFAAEIFGRGIFSVCRDFWPDPPDRPIKVALARACTAWYRCPKCHDQGPRKQYSAGDVFEPGMCRRECGVPNWGRAIE